MNESSNLSSMLHNRADIQPGYRLKDHRLLPGGLSSHNSQEILDVPGYIVEWLHLEEAEEGPNTNPCLENKVEVTH